MCLRQGEEWKTASSTTSCHFEYCLIYNVWGTYIYNIEEYICLPKRSLPTCLSLDQDLFDHRFKSSFSVLPNLIFYFIHGQPKRSSSMGCSIQTSQNYSNIHFQGIFTTTVARHSSNINSLWIVSLVDHHFMPSNDANVTFHATQQWRQLSQYCR